MEFLGGLYLSRVVPVPLRRPSWVGQLVDRDALHPQNLRHHIIDPGVERKAFPLLDSRTRHWRYFLLIGPRPRWTASLGNRILQIVRRNISSPGGRATRGVGAHIYNRIRDRRRRPSPKDLLAVAERLRDTYGSAAQAFWQAAKTDRGYDILVEAADRLRRDSAFEGFFVRQGSPAGWARSAFYRIMARQSPEAEEFARLFARRKYCDIWDSMSRVKRGTLRSRQARLIALSWCLIRCLYEVGVEPSEYEDDDEWDELWSDQSFEEMRRLAKAALRMSTEPEAIKVLPNDTLVQIRQHLRTAIKRKKYRAPLQKPEVPAYQMRQNLFPGFRLFAFNELLKGTTSLRLRR